MNATPRRDLIGFNEDLEGVYEGDMRTVPGEPGTLIIECSIRQPPSMKGRTIYVWFSGDDLTDVLRLARDEAIRLRSQPLEATP